MNIKYEWRLVRKHENHVFGNVWDPNYWIFMILLSTASMVIAFANWPEYPEMRQDLKTAVFITIMCLVISAFIEGMREDMDY